MSVSIVLTDCKSPVALAVRQALQDWAAAGLLRRFIWVDRASVTEPSLAALLVDGETGRRILLADWLPGNIDSTETVQMFVLQLPDTADPIELSTAERVTERAGLHSQRCTVLNLIAPGLGDSAPPISEPWHGRMNLLIYPVDSIEPEATGHQRLRSGDPNFATNVASGLASLAGLWQGMAEPAVAAVADDVIVDAQVRAIRCFVGMIDGSATLAGLRTELDSRGALPAPYLGRGRITEVERAHATVQVDRVAQELTDRHPELRFTPPQDFRPPPTRKVRLRQVLADFFGFLLASIRGMPRRWYNERIDAAAQQLTQIFYGHNSAYQVILRPVGLDQPDLVDHLAAGISDAGRELGTPALPNTSQIWHSLHKTVTGLVDGSDLPDGIGPPEEGGERAVISDPALLAARPDAATVTVGYGMVTGAGEIGIVAQDPLGALMARELLAEEQERVGQGSPTSGMLATTADAIDRFGSQQHSLLWQFQLRLAEQVQAARRAVRGMVIADNQAANDLLDRARAAQHSAGRFIRRMLLALLIAVAAIVALIVSPVLSLLIGLILLVVVVAGWLTGTVWGYFNRQRLLYQLLHEADLVPQRREWAQRARSHLQGELSRLVSLYRQSRLWADIYSKSVHSVFGIEARAQAGSGRIGLLGGELPLHMRIGEAAFDSRQQVQLCRELGSSLFAVNWFSERLHRRFELALGTEGGMPEVDQQLWNDQGINPTNPLRTLAKHVDDDAVRAAVSDELTEAIVNWARKRQGGATGAGWLSEQLMPSVRLLAGQLPENLSQSTSSAFVLRVLESSTWQAALPPDGFTASGRAQSAPRLTRSAIASYAAGGGDGAYRLATRNDPGTIGLDQLAVRVDFTNPLTAEQLVFTDRSRQTRYPEPVSDEQPDPDLPWVPKVTG